MCKLELELAWTRQCSTEVNGRMLIYITGGFDSICWDLFPADFSSVTEQQKKLGFPSIAVILLMEMWLTRCFFSNPSMLMFVSEFELLFCKPVRHSCFPQAPWIIEDKRPPADWPSRGELEFVGYSVRYRKGLDLVLKDLNLRVHGGEKVGAQPWGSAVALGTGVRHRAYTHSYPGGGDDTSWPALTTMAASSRQEAIEPPAWGFLDFPS